MWVDKLPVSFLEFYKTLNKYKEISCQGALNIYQANATVKFFVKHYEECIFINAIYHYWEIWQTLEFQQVKP